MNKLIASLVIACALAASGCVSPRVSTFSNAFVQGLLATLPHSFTGSKVIEEQTGFNVGFKIEFSGLKYDDSAKAWTWTAAKYQGHSPWTATSIIDAPENK